MNVFSSNQNDQVGLKFILSSSICVAKPSASGLSKYKRMICVCPLGWLKKHSATKRNETESVEVMWMNPEPVIQSEVCQEEKNKYCTPANIYGI